MEVTEVESHRRIEPCCRVFGQEEIYGKRLGRLMSAKLHATGNRKFYRAGVAKAEIARRYLDAGRTSVRGLRNRYKLNEQKISVFMLLVSDSHEPRDRQLRDLPSLFLGGRSRSERRY